ncbi:MAG: 30S ribosomal protein S16 [Bdellovibrionota bacterium]|nr:30S ribosomal protein S16 [Pseudomonadota bacterium]MDY6089996.1 30S ribosomal protein S16 [Bdellovibrionota bacterium]
MAVTLRLSRHGKKKNPFYRIVATETGFRRDGKYIEIVGSYNPMQDPPLVVLKEERVKSWIENGAKPSALVRTLIKNNISNIFEDKEEARLAKIKEARRARKDRAKERA